jgi:hypothetical protein
MASMNYCNVIEIVGDIFLKIAIVCLRAFAENPYAKS